MEHITSTNTFADKVRDLKINHNRANEGPLGQKTSEAAHEKNDINKTEKATVSIKQQFNASILQAGLDVSVNAGNESMALLYKAAIVGINDVLKAEFGDDAIQNAYDSGLDVSPEATADRIVSMSTGFFSTYQEQNPDMSDEEAAKSFAQIIGGGIDTGFAEAREILDGLQVLEGDITSNIDATYELVQKGLQEFIDKHVEEKIQ
jgi:hypothetical protein